MKEKKIKLDFAKDLKLFLKTNSRGEYLRKELRRRCSLLLSRYYGHTQKEGYWFDEVAQIRRRHTRLRRRARKHIESLSYPIYLDLKIRYIFKRLYLNKSDKLRVLNSLDLVKFKKNLTKT